MNIRSGVVRFAGSVLSLLLMTAGCGSGVAVDESGAGVGATAAPLSVNATPATPASLFRCVPAAASSGMTPRRASSPFLPGRPVCPAGQVPQPIERFVNKNPPPASGQPSGLKNTAPVDYLYVAFKQALSPGATYANGSGGYLSQPAPVVASGDYHSLGEMAVESGDGRQIVEVGWTVDPGLNGDANPHLFVYHWVDGAATCYNGCGWVQVSKTRFPGMTVAQTTTGQEYEIERLGGDWWVFYQGEGVGYFPGALWSTGSFTQIGLTQWFGEVSAAQTNSCSQMGDGQFGTSITAATMSNLFLVSQSATSVPASISVSAITNPAAYDSGNVTANGFSFGGPGACAMCTPTTCGAQGVSCGNLSDGCGGTLGCGSCARGFTCDGTSCCKPLHRVCRPGQCWEQDDGCGNTICCGGARCCF